MRSGSGIWFGGPGLRTDMSEQHDHHSAAGRGPIDRRIVRKARGLRVYAMLVGVAILSGRVTIRAKPRR